MIYRGIYIDGNEPDRKQRLARVVDAMSDNIRSRIKSLHDHKGMLTVRWLEYMYEPLLAIIIEHIWKTECECLIAHVGESANLDHDTFPYNQFEPHRPI